jgi:hypothetical protein
MVPSCVLTICLYHAYLEKQETVDDDGGGGGGGGGGSSSST